MNPSTHTPDPDTGDPTGRAPTRRSRRGLVAGLSAGLIGGAAAGLVLGVPGLGSAASDSGSAEVPAGLVQVQDDADEGQDADGDRPHHGRRGPSLDAASEIIGLDADEIRDALRDGATLVEIASMNGVSEDDLVAGLVAEAQERLDQAVADGRVDADRAAEISGDLEEKITDAVNGEFERGDRRPGARILRHGVETTTELLGIDTETLRTELQSGKTLVEIAAENGVSEDELVDALVADAQERLDEAAADGKIDADEAAEKSAELEERITERVNGEVPDRVGERIERRQDRREDRREDRLDGDATPADEAPPADGES